jgi:hypothetical protein
VSLKRWRNNSNFAVSSRTTLQRFVASGAYEVVDASRTKYGSLLQCLLYQCLLYQGLLYQGLLYQGLLYQGLLYQGLLYQCWYADQDHRPRRIEA